VNFGLLTAEIVSLVWGTPANFNGFRALTALLHGILVLGVKLCGVEQKAPPIFDRAAITLGIGPHSSFPLKRDACQPNEFSLLFTRFLHRHSMQNAPTLASFIMVALRSRCGHYIFALLFLLLLSSFFLA